MKSGRYGGIADDWRMRRGKVCASRERLLQQGATVASRRLGSALCALHIPRMVGTCVYVCVCGRKRDPDVCACVCDCVCARGGCFVRDVIVHGGGHGGCFIRSILMPPDVSQLFSLQRFLDTKRFSQCESGFSLSFVFL